MKYPVYLFALFTVLCFAASCDDNLNEVGSSIRPGGDDMNAETDSFMVKAQTVRMDSIYAWSTTGLLGKYENDFFGAIKSGYLTQLYSSEKSAFKGRNIVIDSVYLNIDFRKYYGDTLSPMGLSVYKVNKELPVNFYTNIDPTKYCDMSKILGQQTFTIANTSIFYKSTSNGSIKYRMLQARLGKQLGIDFYNEWLKNGDLFKSKESLQAFFPGVYVTSTFGAGSLVETENTMLNIHYTCNDSIRRRKDPKNEKDTTTIVVDSILHRTLALDYTSDVLQLHSVKNSNDDQLLNDNSSPRSVYMKSPAGVCVELELPIKEIADRLSKDPSYYLNSAKYTLSGFSEKEAKINVGLAKPSMLLLIDKSTVKDFFRNDQIVNDSTNMLFNYSKATNSYDVYNKNLAVMIKKYIKKGGLTQNPKFLLIPVTVTTDIDSKTGLSRYRVANYMTPMATVIRADDEYMKMGIIFSKF